MLGSAICPKHIGTRWGKAHRYEPPASGERAGAEASADYASMNGLCLSREKRKNSKLRNGHHHPVLRILSPKNPRVAQAYILISIPTDTSTIFGGVHFMCLRPYVAKADLCRVQPTLKGSGRQQILEKCYFFARTASAVPWMKAWIFTTSSSDNLPVKSGMP